MRKTAIAAILIVASLKVSAQQSGTNSPYSMYGFGLLSEQSNGQGRGMSGLSYGLREHNQVNYMNPASYSSIDSLSFIFDAGLSGQITNFKEGGKKVNAKNADFDYVIAGFRMFKHFGASFGLLPFSNVGYSFSNTSIVSKPTDTDPTTANTTYNGNGGTHQAYIGAGWEPIKGLSLGANISYIWGDIDQTMSLSYSDSYVNTVARYYTAKVKSYKLDFGVQYSKNITKEDMITVGATFTPGHKMKANAKVYSISTNTQTGIADSTILPKKGQGLDYEMPATLGLGLLFNHINKWKIGIDYNFQKWSSCEYPIFKIDNDGNQNYEESDKVFNDRHKITLGSEYTPNENSRNFFKKMRYRFGGFYATNYIKINGENGPKEYGLSAGLGIPIINTYNNRSTLNISAQWICRDASSFIKENTFLINIGLVFNERWFAKWKVE